MASNNLYNPIPFPEKEQCSHLKRQKAKFRTLSATILLSSFSVSHSFPSLERLVMISHIPEVLFIFFFSFSLFSFCSSNWISLTDLTSNSLIYSPVCYLALPESSYILLYFSVLKFSFGSSL